MAFKFFTDDCLRRAYKRADRDFVRIHQTLKVTPAMAAGVTDRLGEMSDVVDLLEAFEAARKRAA